jgi:hypothetical protein
MKRTVPLWEKMASHCLHTYSDPPAPLSLAPGPARMVTFCAIDFAGLTVTEHITDLHNELSEPTLELVVAGHGEAVRDVRYLQRGEK